MAITKEQSPTGFVPVNQRLIVNLTSDNTSEPKFRYKIQLTDITDGGSTLLSTSYIDPNPDDNGIYDCAPRLRELVKAQITNQLNLPDLKAITDLPTDKCYIETTGAQMEIQCDYEESYAATANDEPTDQGGGGNFTFTIYNGSSLIENGVNYYNGKGAFVSANPPIEALMTVTPEDSSGNKEISVGYDDRFCLAWFNSGETAVPVTLWRYTIYFNDDTSSIVDIDVSTYKQGNGDDTMMYFMCGPKDLSNFTGITESRRPIEENDWDYYTVEPRDTAVIGARYRFNNRKRCSRYDNYQLMFANIDGAWSFQTFNLVSEKVIQTKGGKTYTAQAGTVDYGDYHVAGYSREDFEINKQGRVLIELNTDWLSKEQAEDLEEYIYSPDVYLILNGSTTPSPVIVKERSFRPDKYKKLRQYKLTVEVAQFYHRL